MRKVTYTNARGQSVEFWKTPYLITALDGIEAAQTTVQQQQAPYQDGVTWIDSRFQPRVVAISGTFVKRSLALDYANRASMQAILNPALGMGTLTLQTDQGTVNIPAIHQVPLFPSKDLTTPFQAWQLQFFCPSPYWLDPAASSINLSYVSGGKTFPFTFPFKFGTYTGVVPKDARNAGDSPTPINIQIVGPAANPLIQNLTTGLQIKCNTVLGVGDVLTISTKFGSKSVTLSQGGVLSNQMATLDASSTFFQLGLGSSMIQFSNDLTTAAPTCLVSWVSRYSGR